MGRRRSAALVLACWLLAACTYTAVPAESSAFACSNNDDDDGDFKADCLDPDCWGFAHCRVNADASVPMTPVVPLPSGVPAPLADPLVPPVGGSDASQIDNPWLPDADVPVDGSVDAEADAGIPLVCSEYCPEGECDNGVCKVPLDLGEFEITRIDLRIPREMSNGECFDAIGNCVGFELRCCPPDPFVIVRVGDEKAGVVQATDSAFKAWNAPGILLKLREGDELTFEVVDNDNTEVGDQDDLIAQAVFTCTTIVTLGKALDARALGCTPNSDDRPLGNLLEYGVTATIEQISREAP